ARVRRLKRCERRPELVEAPDDCSRAVPEATSRASPVILALPVRLYVEPSSSRLTVTLATCVPPMVTVYSATALSGAAAAGIASRPSPRSRAPSGLRITALNTKHFLRASRRAIESLERPTCLRQLALAR